MKFNRLEIGELVTLRQGFAINKKTNYHISEKRTNLPLLRIGDMKDGAFKVFVRDTIPDKFIAKKSDVIYTRTGQVGAVFRGQLGVIHNNCFTVNTKDETILLQEFIFYMLQEKAFYEEAVSRATGAAQPDLPHGVFNSIQVFLPPIDSQRNIIKILSNYDNLIENNQKQIKLLEEVVQRLYKEWFIDLRFPGHENMEIVDGVPRGWTRKTVLDCLETYIGGGWGKEDITSKNTIAGKVIRGTDINDIKSGIYTGIPLRYHTENDKKKRTLKKNDIVFELSNGNIDNIGRSLLIDELILNNCGENTICASFCKLFRPLDEIHSLLLYLEILDMNSSGRMLPYKKQGSNGINNFAFEDFLLHELLIPSDYKMVAFIDTIMSKIMVARSQLALLQEARNRLLPKLMSGEIEV